MEKMQELANEIYVFVDKTSLGIKFYDRSKEPSMRFMYGDLPTDHFFTEAGSFEQVEWDDKVNVANGKQRVHYMDGSHDATTYIVSEEVFLSILEQFAKAVERGTDAVVKVDLSKKLILNNNLPEQYPITENIESKYKQDIIDNYESDFNNSSKKSI